MPASLSAGRASIKIALMSTIPGGHRAQARPEGGAGAVPRAMAAHRIPNHYEHKHSSAGGYRRPC